jgi:anthranilate phosphoribosyltransferase
LSLLAEGEALSADQTRALVGAMMAGELSEAQIAAFLTALRVRGETVDEIVGTAEAMRDRLPTVPIDADSVLDTCGTGGDHARTFNISTAVAIVVAACGAPVAKHGNRSVSSTSGSAEVLKELGVRIDLPPEKVVDCLKRIGIAFFFAPTWHAAMKHAAPVRQQLRFRTVFNLVGPLCNPARARQQLVGVGRWEWADKLAEALERLGTRSAAVVSGEDGLDEVTLAGATRAVIVHDGRRTVEILTPDHFGLPPATKADWQVNSPAESALVLRRVLEGECGPRRDIVLANAAVALRIVGKASNLVDGVRIASSAIDDGSANAKLQQLIDATQTE